MHVPRVLRVPRPRGHDDGELGEPWRQARGAVAPSEARVRDGLLHQVGKSGARQHDAERSVDATAGAAQHALDERLLLVRHRVVRGGTRDPAAAQPGDGSPQVLDGGLLALGCRRPGAFRARLSRRGSGSRGGRRHDQRDLQHGPAHVLLLRSAPSAHPAGTGPAGGRTRHGPPTPGLSRSLYACRMIDPGPDRPEPPDSRAPVQAPWLAPRIVALLEVILCSDYPTQAALTATLNALGYTAYDSGELRVGFVVALSLVDTVLLLALIVF